MSLDASIYNMRSKKLYFGMVYILRQAQITIGKKKSNEQVIGGLYAGFELLEDRVLLQDTCRRGAAGAVDVATTEDLATIKEIQSVSRANFTQTKSIFTGVDVAGTYNSKILMGRNPITGEWSFYQVLNENDHARNRYYRPIQKPIPNTGARLQVLPPGVTSRTKFVLGNTDFTKSNGNNESVRNPIWDRVAAGHCILIQEIVQPSSDAEKSKAKDDAINGLNYIATGQVYIVSGGDYHFLDSNGAPSSDHPIEVEGHLQRYQTNQQGVVGNVLDLTTLPIPSFEYPLYDTGYMISPFETGETTIIKAWKQIYQINQRGVVYPDYQTLGGFWYQVLNIATLVAKTTLYQWLLDNRSTLPDNLPWHLLTARDAIIYLPAPPAPATCYVSGDTPGVNDIGEGPVFNLNTHTTPHHLTSACIHHMTPFCVPATQLGQIKNGLVKYFTLLQKKFLPSHFSTMSPKDISSLLTDGNDYCLKLVKGTISQSAHSKFKKVKKSIAAAVKLKKWFCTLDGLVEPKPAVDHCYGLHLTGCISMAAFPQIFTMLNQKNNILKSDRQMICAHFDSWLAEVSTTVLSQKPSSSSSSSSTNESKESTGASNSEFWEALEKAGSADMTRGDVFTCRLGTRPWLPEEADAENPQSALDAEFNLDFSTRFLKGSTREKSRKMEQLTISRTARAGNTRIDTMRSSGPKESELSGDMQHLGIDKLNSCWVDKVLLLVSMFPRLEEDILTCFETQTLDLLKKYVVRLTGKASDDFRIANASAAQSQRYTRLMSPLNGEWRKDRIDHIVDRHMAATIIGREIYETPRNTIDISSYGGSTVPNSEPLNSDHHLREKLDFRVPALRQPKAKGKAISRLSTTTNSGDHDGDHNMKDADTASSSSSTPVASANVKIQVTGKDSRLADFSTFSFGFGFCMYDRFKEVTIQELVTNEVGLSTTIANLDRLLRKVLFRYDGETEALETGSPKPENKQEMVPVKRVREWCAESWGGDYAGKMMWRLDSIIFAYCEEYIFFHLWKRMNDPLLPHDVDLISSYMGDLRLLCAHFRMVYDTLDPDNLERKNITFRRWMVARCVLARLEVGTGSMTTLIRDKVNNVRDNFMRVQVKMDDDREQLVTEIGAVTKERDQLVQERVDLGQELAAVTEQREQLGQERDDLRQELTAVTEQRDQFGQDLTAVTEQRDQVGQERDDLRQAMTTVTTERDRLGQDLDTVTEQREQIRGELAAVTTERDGMREKNAALEEELRMMRLQVGKRIEALQGQGGKGKKKRRKKTKRRRKKKKKTRRRR